LSPLKIKSLLNVKTKPLSIIALSDIKFQVISNVKQILNSFLNFICLKSYLFINSFHFSRKGLVISDTRDSTICAHDCDFKLIFWWDWVSCDMSKTPVINEPSILSITYFVYERILFLMYHKSTSKRLYKIMYNNYLSIFGGF
jgi:hypothetical protein